jgi:hypothetical protein
MTASHANSSTPQRFFQLQTAIALNIQFIRYLIAQ